MKTKILMFGWEFPPFNSGGLGTACFGLTKALSVNNVEIIFVLPRPMDINPGKMKVCFPKSAKVKIKKTDFLLIPYKTPQAYAKEKILHGRDNYGNSLFDEILRYGLNAGSLAKENDFDIIHAHDWMSFIAGMEAKKTSGKPLVVHVHSTEVDRTGGNNINSEIFKIEKAGMEAADAVIAVSNLTKNIIVENYGIDPGKIYVVHNGIDTNDYPPIDTDSRAVSMLKEAGNKIVLFVGRITVQKGPDYFLRSAKKVLEYKKNVYFVIAGSGDMEHKIIEEAANLGISDRVLFAGFLRGEELNKIYRSADLFVMPSVSEPFGITALESVINGTPVLVSKQSGVKEVLTHVLSADFWDSDEMANKILAVLNYGSLNLTLKQNGGEQVKNISWNQAAKRCIDVYRNILDGYFLKLS